MSEDGTKHRLRGTQLAIIRDVKSKGMTARDLSDRRLIFIGSAYSQLNFLYVAGYIDRVDVNHNGSEYLYIEKANINTGE